MWSVISFFFFLPLGSEEFSEDCVNLSFFDSGNLPVPFSLSFPLLFGASIAASAWFLEHLMAPIWTKLYCSWFNVAMKSFNGGIFHVSWVNLDAWKDDTNTKYSGPNFERIERMSWSSSFLNPHALISMRRDLNLVNNSCRLLKWIGFMDMSSFSSWCTLIASCLSNSPSNVVQTTSGVVAPLTWKRRSMEIDRHISPIASSNLLKYFIFSATTVGSFFVPF